MWNGSKWFSIHNLCCRLSSQPSFFPTSIVASGIDLVLEMYALFRLISLVDPSLRFLVLQDIRIRRAGSLIVMDLAILIPRAISTNVLGDFLPFAFTAILVLCTLNTFTSLLLG